MILSMLQWLGNEVLKLRPSWHGQSVLGYAGKYNWTLHKHVDKGYWSHVRTSEHCLGEEQACISGVCALLIYCKTSWAIKTLEVQQSGIPIAWPMDAPSTDVIWLSPPPVHWKCWSLAPKGWFSWRITPNFHSPILCGQRIYKNG